jgi:hypothetical protein
VEMDILKQKERELNLIEELLRIYDDLLKNVSGLNKRESALNDELIEVI